MINKSISLIYNYKLNNKIKLPIFENNNTRFTHYPTLI